MEWTQTNTHIILKFNFGLNVKKDKLNININEVFLQVNYTETKEIKYVDFLNEIIEESLKFDIENKSAIFTVEKKEKTKWDGLEFKGDKTAVKERRKLAEEKRVKLLEKINQTSTNVKQELSTFVSNKSMEVGEDLRKVLNKKKDYEKNKEIEKMKEFNDEYYKQKDNNINYIQNNENKLKNTNTDFKVSDNLSNNVKVQNESIIKINRNLDNKINTNNVRQNLNNKNENIRKNEDTIIDISNNDSKLRENSTFEVNLTKKMIPHYAARESLAKEPPMPKSKILKFKDDKQQIHDERNPLWIKDKGDNFFSNKDYINAIECYNKALDIEPDFLKVMINKATCYICIGEYEKAENEIKIVEKIAEDTKKNCEKVEEGFYDRIVATCKSKLCAIYSLIGEFDKFYDCISFLKCQDKLIHKEFMTKILLDEINVVKREIQEIYTKNNFNNLLSKIKEFSTSIKKSDKKNINSNNNSKINFEEKDEVIIFKEFLSECKEIIKENTDYSDVIDNQLTKKYDDEKINDSNNRNEIKNENENLENDKKEDNNESENINTDIIVESKITNATNNLESDNIQNNDIKNNIEINNEELKVYKETSTIQIKEGLSGKIKMIIDINKPNSSKFFNKLFLNDHINTKDNEEIFNKLNEFLCIYSLNFNESMVSNLILIFLELEKFNLTCYLSTELLKNLNHFKNHMSLQQISIIEIKTILRKSKALWSLGYLNAAFEEISKSEKLCFNLKDEGTKREMLKLIENLKEDVREKLIEENLEKANECLKSKDFKNALNLYNECLKITYSNKKGVILYKVLINRSSCFVFLQDYQSALNDLDKVTYLISKQKAINIFSNNTNKELDEEIKNLEFISIVKKAGVLNYLKKPEESLICYESALKIKEDKVIRENYNKLTFNLNSNSCKI